MPKGIGKGFTSARFIQRDPNRPAITNSNEKQIPGMIQNSIAKQLAPFFR